MLDGFLTVDQIAKLYKIFGYRVVAVTVGGREQLCVVSVTRDLLQHVDVVVGQRREPMVLNAYSKFKYRWL